MTMKNEMYNYNWMNKKKILRRFLFEISLNRMTILFVLDTVYLSCKMLGFKCVEREDK